MFRNAPNPDAFEVPAKRRCVQETANKGIASAQVDVSSRDSCIRVCGTSLTSEKAANWGRI